jgi:hypothetical protein
MADLHGQGFKVVTIIDPGVKADRKYRVFQDGLARGMFCRYPDGRVFIGPVWPGNCAFPDFTDPRVREWWGDLHRDLVEAGVDGIWDDMNEPALFGEDDATIPGPVRHDLDGAGGDHRVAHNLYGLNMARATAEGLARLTPDRRPLRHHPFRVDGGSSATPRTGPPTTAPTGRRSGRRCRWCSTWGFPASPSPAPTSAGLRASPRGNSSPAGCR